VGKFPPINDQDSIDVAKSRPLADGIDEQYGIELINGLFVCLKNVLFILGEKNIGN
jgi:hypothetical protein